MRYVHRLAGCAPAPLAHYLKALGVFRLVAEQRDPLARGWWRDECFHLATTLDRDALMRFLLEEYEPSPAFNPWGGRSGYYSGGSERTAREALQKIETSPSIRFNVFRSDTSAIRNHLGPSKVKDDDAKRHLILSLRATLSDAAIGWLDACTAIVGGRVAQPAVFGTGGNEGSGSYTSAYMAAIVDCLIERRYDDALGTALLGTVVPNARSSGSFGQFLPSRIGTPWDLLFVFEGAMLLRSSVSMRSTATDGNRADRWLASPFVVASRATGYGSSAPPDEVVINKGKTLPGRGEQWFPIWCSPTSLEELRALFSQGRAVVRRQPARDGYGIARAIGSFGIQRGITEFVRYGYQQRNNAATHFAVVLGRYRVPERPSCQLSCLDDIDLWRRRVVAEARHKQAPSRLQSAERRLSDGLFDVVQHPGEPVRWQRVLLALADVEAIMASGSGFGSGPIPRLSPGWVDAADDGSVELRLAVAFALQGVKGERRWDGVRRHWLPLDDTGRRFDTTGDTMARRLKRKPDVVLAGRDGVTDAIALVERRLVEASQRGVRQLLLDATPRAAAGLSDLAAFLAGEVDVDRTLALGRALMAVDIRAWHHLARPPRIRSTESRWPDDAWLLLRLALLPWPLDGLMIGADPAIVRRLAAGDPTTGFELARRRLEAAGIHAGIRLATVDSRRARLWAAALAFPISTRTARSIARRVDPASATKGSPA